MSNMSLLLKGDVK